jgi:hypothetical protein
MIAPCRSRTDRNRTRHTRYSDSRCTPDTWQQRQHVPSETPRAPSVVRIKVVLAHLLRLERVAPELFGRL